MLLLTTQIFAEDNNNSLEFSAMKTKHMSLDVNIVTPIYITGYTSTDSFTYKTSIFPSTRTQTVDVNAYYIDENGNKVFGEIVSENENRYVIFKVDSITKDEYVFYTTGTIVSENKILLNNLEHSLSKGIQEEEDYQKPTRFIQSDSLEIKAIANYLKTTDDALENLVNVTNWVFDYMEYNIDYVESINDSKEVLSDRKGVCDEFAILEAAILRAQGYPVKYVVGYANTSVEWGPHAWLEVYVPNQGWIPVDPTYNEVGYVDSSHIILEKLKDPIESKDSVNTQSNLNVVFGIKEISFIHKDIKTYEEKGYKDILGMELDYTLDNISNSPFAVKLTMQNKTQDQLAILVVSQVSQEFKILYPKTKKRVYYFKPFEEKTVYYYFVLPDVNNSYRYGFGFSSQLNDITDFVNIHENKGVYLELFLANPPVLYFKDGFFYFEQEFFNYTNKDKNLVFEFDYNGVKTSEPQAIQKKSGLLYTKQFPIIEDANFSYVISGDYAISGNTTLYKEEELEEIQPEPEQIDTVNDTTLEDENDYIKLFNEIESKQIKEKSEINYLIVVLIAVFLVFILFLFVTSSLKKQNIN